MSGEDIKIIKCIGKRKMTNDITPEEVELVHNLLKKGHDLDSITHAIVVKRTVNIHNDIRNKIETIIKDGEKDG